MVCQYVYERAEVNKGGKGNVNCVFHARLRSQCLNRTKVQRKPPSIPFCYSFLFFLLLLYPLYMFMIQSTAFQYIAKATHKSNVDATTLGMMFLSMHAHTLVMQRGRKS